MNENVFREQLQERGYGDARVVEYEPNLAREMHTHEFSAMALVTNGELTLALEGGTTTYGPGDWCEIMAGTVHTERTGPTGATMLIATK